MLELPQRRAGGPLAIGLTVLGALVAGRSVAQAAMGTSNTLITTARPDLISVTTPGSQSGPIARLLLHQGARHRRRRRAGRLLRSAAMTATSPLAGVDFNQINNFCIEVPFGNDAADDLVAYTFGQVAEGAVEADTGGGANLADSAALNGSTPTTAPAASRSGPTCRPCRSARPRTRSPTSSTRRSSIRVNDGTGFTYVDQAGDVHTSACAAR